METLRPFYSIWMEFLVDSMNYHLKSWKELLGSFKVTVSDQFIFEHEGAMAPEIISDLFKENGTPIDEEQIADIYMTQNSMFLTRYLSLVESLSGFIAFIDPIKD